LRLAGREISRDVIASLKRYELIDCAIRAPQPGAPFAYVTTKRFLEAFGFASLRFEEAGVAVEYLDGETPREDREAIFPRSDPARRRSYAASAC
jgi:chromosome segregation and condensation protein ScpB